MAMEQATSFHDVVIVGAGLAGLSAAEYLIENGISDVIILEADNRVGGRVQTFFDTENNTVFDFGAQWIHGSSENSLWTFASERNLIEDSVKTYDGEGFFFREGGRVIQENLVTEIKQFMDSTLESCSSFSRIKSKEITPMNVMEHLEKGIRNYLNVCSDDLEDRKALLQWHIRYQVIDNACFSMSDLCSIAWGEYKECEGEYCNTIKGGFEKVIELLRQKIPSERVRTKSKVYSVELIEDSNLNGGVLVKSSSGWYLANHVIYTPSVECLKRTFDVFVPKLESRVLKAISQISMGTINKIFLIFEEKFWRDNTKGFQLVFDETNGNEKEWLTEWWSGLTGFDIFPFHPACLVAWVGGHGAQLTESLDDEKIKTDCVRLLQRFCPEQEIPPIKSMHRTKWYSNDLARGAYSYRTAPFDIRLQDPIWIQDEKPLLLFAGEAYSFNHYATAHGAYESAFRRDPSTNVGDGLKGSRYPFVTTPNAKRQQATRSSDTGEEDLDYRGLHMNKLSD